MGYTPHQWKTGDIVSSTNLNEMEAGIAGSQEKITVDAKLSADLISEGDNNKLVSAAEKTNWNSKSTVSVPAESTSTNEAKFLKIGDAEYKLATGQGKVWKDLTLTSANIITMAAGDEVVGTFETYYDDAKFKDDYFMCNIEQKAYEDARSIFVGEELNKVFVNTEGFNDSIAYLAGSVVNVIRERGFDYNYYKTIVLYASNIRDQGKTRILDGKTTTLLNATNVIYLQDVSQQSWEYNYQDPKYIEKQRREQLYETEMGKAFVISVRGKDNTTANCATFLYCMESSQASYWDETNGAIKWANVEAGEVYPVHFDTEHDSLRWLLDAVYKPAGYDTYFGVAMTSTRKAELLAGLEFSKETVEGEQKPWLASAMVVSKGESIETDCLGNGIGPLRNIFSFNTSFGAEYTDTIHYIGRPTAHVSDSTTYTKWISPTQSETIIEKDGYYLWTCDVDGVPVELIIPDNYYIDEGKTEPTPHRDTYFVRINMSNMNSTQTIFRHTFTITTPSTLYVGQWELNLAMCAVNPDQGDSAMEYLLHSDETEYQDYDWILPVSGTIGRVVGYGYKGDVIYPNKKYAMATLTTTYDLARFEDLWESLPKQRDNKYYIFYGTDPSSVPTANRLINMRIEKEAIEHAFDLYVYDDYDKQSEEDTGKPLIRFVTQAIGDVQKGFYEWDTATHDWKTAAITEDFPNLFTSTGVQGVEKVEIEGDSVYVGWDNAGLFEIFSSSEEDEKFRSINKVAHTFTAMRMLAGWQTITEEGKEKRVRTLFIDYIDKANEWTRVPVVTDDNMGQYFCRDFRSEVLMVRTPYSSKRLKAALAK